MNLSSFFQSSYKKDIFSLSKNATHILPKLIMLIYKINKFKLYNK